MKTSTRGWFATVVLAAGAGGAIAQDAGGPDALEPVEHRELTTGAAPGSADGASTDDAGGLGRVSLGNDVRRGRDGKRGAPFGASLALFWDNDGGYHRWWSDDDGHYTNGIRGELAWASRSFDDLAAWLPGASGFESMDVLGGVSIGHHMYTPDEIEIEELVDGDRPYAGYLYGGFFLQRSDRWKLDHFEIDLGVVGPYAGAEGLQKQVHRISDSPDPAGWDNQIDNEPTIDLRYTRKWRTERVRLFDALDGDLIPQAGGRLGNYQISAEAGATARIGFNLPDDFGPGRVYEFKDHAGVWRETFGAYAYARAIGRAIARDITLDGNTFWSSENIDKRWAVGEASLGVAVAWWPSERWAIELGYAHTWETERFEGQSGGDAYGSLIINATWGF